MLCIGKNVPSWHKSGILAISPADGGIAGLDTENVDLSSEAASFFAKDLN